ncbi:aminotransferase class I/II-fold pyridoxal phosphate-dependent enzyme [Paenibacillus antri]|uniref:Aminotransferase class I/II-fold pyridoxal phosphate-dependent enzyme n=1 Tax=Paenibacillus antri TaxID=2582848 RepID=A0A5R9GAH8_9BACL|nr:aminotransferase class I/II-fold pyridoxal phosphate-dependent enzyme [Paenibacillus antri]TLS53467.1 aminotransferase class I/II-fold pyridoxal phosphate-dependent enzyme [Paenibacillus antri]
MNPQAVQLNETLSRVAPVVHDMLSRLGLGMYFPKVGILNQSAEAKKQATTFNATIGIATEGKTPMHLGMIQETLSAYAPSDLYPYAPPEGKPELRGVWREKMLSENPSLAGKTFGKPIVTNALTHGLSIVADLFADEGDAVIMPEKNWENYELTFGVRRGANIVTFPLYNEDGLFNSEGLLASVLAQKERGKAIVVLNFPNNPTGYTPTAREADDILSAVKAGAEAGVKTVVVTDDAYFGLFFEDSLRESLFGRLIGLHPNVLPVKVDGATKEEFVWGFRVGFITFGCESPEANEALEQKTLGIIRGTVSSCSHPSQTFVLKALQHPDFEKQRDEKVAILKARANRTKQVLDAGKYDDAWDYYPFNSGYFMCLKLKTVKAESLRRHALEKFGVGTIALGDTDLRVAFSCLEEGDIEKLFELLYQGVKELEQA